MVRIISLLHMLGIVISSNFSLSRPAVPADNACMVHFVSLLHMLGIATSSNFSLWSCPNQVVIANQCAHWCGNLRQQSAFSQEIATAGEARLAMTTKFILLDKPEFRKQKLRVRTVCPSGAFYVSHGDRLRIFPNQALGIEEANLFLSHPEGDLLGNTHLSIQIDR